MKTRRTLLALAALLLLAADKETKPKYSTFTSKEGKFSVLLPGTSVKQTKAPSTSDPDVLTHTFRAGKGTTVYEVSYFDDPSLAKADAKLLARALESGRDRTLAGFKAAGLKTKLVSDKAIMLGKYPGREFAIDLEKVGFYRARIYAVGPRLYQVILLAPRKVATSGESDKYFASFKLVE